MNGSLQRRIDAAGRPTAAVVYLPFVHDQPEADVERINSFSFYDIGKDFKAFEALPESIHPQQLFWPLSAARSAIRSLLDGKPIPLGICRGKAAAFQEAMNTLFNEQYMTGKDAAGNPEFKFPDESAAPVQGWQLNWIKRALADFETVFAEEMKETATYFVPRRGIYWTPALVDTADESFPESIRGYIPQKTRDDWKAAGRCLAFNLLSAAGFHTARAVEGTLEAYYQLFSGKPGKTLRNWNDYIETLRKIASKGPTPSPQEKTLAELDQMRQDYRNPIMHPRVVLTEPDARMLFANGESLIIAMAQEILAAREQGGVQLALASDETKPIVGPGTGQSSAGDTADAPEPAKTKLRTKE